MRKGKRKEREQTAWCFWTQFLSFPSLLLATATIHDAICYSKLLREGQRHTSRLTTVTQQQLNTQYSI
jgi:hypothetical protein